MSNGIARASLVSLVLGIGAMTSPVMGQNVGVQPPSALHVDSVRDSALANVLLNNRLLKEGNVHASFYRVFAVSGGSADSSGYGELVVDWVYIVLGDEGEDPGPGNVHRLGPMFGARVESVEAYGDGALFQVTYGKRTSRRTAWVAVTSNAIKVFDKRPKQ